jgi:hypothetical protein
MPLEKWRYKTDQDLLPEWYVESEEEKRVRAVLPDWLKSNVVLPDQSVAEIRKPMVAIYGTVKYIDGGTVGYIRGGTVESIRGGTVESIDGGTVKYINGGTVGSIHGGTVGYIRGQFPSRVTGNPTIINYGLLTPDILKSSQAVLVDRSKGTVTCFVGKDI